MASNYLNRRVRSEEEVSATTHHNEMVFAQNAFLDFKAKLTLIAKSSRLPKTEEAIKAMLMSADDLYHDEIGPALSVAENAVSEFDADREAESVRQEMSMTQFRQLGR